MKKNGLFALTALILGYLLFPNYVNSAITVDTSGGLDGSSTSVTISSGNSDTMLLAGFGGGNFNDSTACTWNGGAMTIDEENLTDYDDFGISSLADPDTGTHTLACGDTSSEDGTYWVSIYNVDQGSPESTNSCTQRSGACTPATISSGSILWGGLKDDRGLGGSQTAGTGLTLLSGEATSCAAYGVGATTWIINNMEGNGYKRMVSGSYKEASASTSSRRVIMIN